MICIDWFFFLKFKKNFSNGGNREFGEIRTPLGWMAANCHKNHKVVVFGEEVFKRDFQHALKRGENREAKKKGSSSGSSGLVKEKERARWDCWGDLWKRTHLTWSQTAFLEGNFSRYGQMKFVFSHLYMIQYHHFFLQILVLSCWLMWIFKVDCFSCWMVLNMCMLCPGLSCSFFFFFNIYASLILVSKNRALVLWYPPPIFKPFDKIREHKNLAHRLCS